MTLDPFVYFTECQKKIIVSSTLPLCVVIKTVTFLQVAEVDIAVLAFHSGLVLVAQRWKISSPSSSSDSSSERAISSLVT